MGAGFATLGKVYDRGMRISIAMVVALVACSGSAPANDMCTGAAYDPCNDEHDCDSSMCQNFMMEGFQVCTVACDASNPCPSNGTCNDMGICKPAKPNTCKL